MEASSSQASQPSSAPSLDLGWHFLSPKGERNGPIMETTFATLVKEGKITPTTYVWKEGMPDWKHYRDLNSDLSLSPPLPLQEIAPELSSSSSKRKRRGKSVSASSAEAPPVYAGFWVRVLAKLLDYWFLKIPIKIIVLGALVLGMPTPSVSPNSFPLKAGSLQTLSPSLLIPLLLPLFLQLGLLLLIWAVYIVYFVGRFGATPGKMICRIEIINVDRTALTYIQAANRFVCEILSFMILLMGYALAPFDAQKRTLHDRLCETRVVKKNGPGIVDSALALRTKLSTLLSILFGRLRKRLRLFPKKPPQSP